MILTRNSPCMSRTLESKRLKRSSSQIGRLESPTSQTNSRDSHEHESIVFVSPQYFSRFPHTFLPFHHCTLPTSSINSDYPILSTWTNILYIGRIPSWAGTSGNGTVSTTRIPVTGSLPETWTIQVRIIPFMSCLSSLLIPIHLMYHASVN